MNLRGAKVLLTGAGGGIGLATATRLAESGALLALVGRDAERLDAAAAATARQGVQARTFAFDLAAGEGHAELVARIHAALGGLDLVINNAGVSSFCALAEEDPARIEAIVRTNLVAPVLLARAALPGMIAQRRGRIVNVGSVYGSIGFAYFSAYSASKFGLRGFSEALRRELAGTGVGVTYVAPRGVRTDMNPAAVYRMSEQVKMQFDPPEAVADAIAGAIERERAEVYVGGPEGFFARLNGLLPRVVDRALRRQNVIAGDFATQSAATRNALPGAAHIT
jgi:short-subunit dehydrogenase